MTKLITFPVVYCKECLCLQLQETDVESKTITFVHNCNHECADTYLHSYSLDSYIFALK